MRPRRRSNNPRGRSSGPRSRLSASLLALLLAVTAAGCGSVELPAGTGLVVELDQAISPDEVAAGDAVTARLAGNLKQGDEVLLPAGTVFRGQVSAVQPLRGQWPMVVKLDFTEVEVAGEAHPVSLRVVSVETERTETGSGVAGDLVGSAVSGREAAPFLGPDVSGEPGTAVVLATEAESARIPAGARLELELLATVKIPGG